MSTRDPVDPTVPRVTAHMDYAQFERLSRKGDASKEACGLRFRAALRALNMSQTAFARLTKQKQGAISNAMRGANFPSRESMEHLYRAYGIDFNYIMIGAVGSVPGDMQMRLYVALEASASEQDQKSD